jgi:hypothetical protein
MEGLSGVPKLTINTPVLPTGAFAATGGCRTGASIQGKQEIDGLSLGF